MALTRITKGVIKPNENYDTHNINSTGIVTAVGANFTGDVSVGGILTYEDVTSIDSVGIITARQGIHVGAGLSVVGVSTFSADLYVAENIIHTGDTDTKIRFADVGNKIQLQSGGTTRIQTNSIGAQIDTTLLLYGPAGNPGRLRMQEGGALCEIRCVRNTDTSSFLYFDTEISGTTATRLIIDGTGSLRPATDSDYDLGSNTIRWANVYADNYYGSTLTLAGNADFNGDIDVDGHTNLDNVSIAGVTTISTSIDKHLILSGSSSPYISFEESSTAKAYIQWNAAGHLELRNQEDDSTLYIKDALTFQQSVGGTQHTIWHSGNDGSGSTLDADLLDGQEGSYYITTINGNTNNRLVTATGTANTLQGEANLTFSGSTLKVNSTTGHSYLKINSNDSYSGSIHFGDQSDDDAAQIWYDNYQGNGMYLRTSENTPMSFYTNSKQRLHIQSNGDIVLGTASDAGNKLYFQSTSGAAQYIASGGTNNQSLIIGSSAGEFVQIASNGNALFGGTAVSQTNRQLALGSNAEANFAIETHNNAASESSNIRFYKSRGTAASPTAVADNHYISQLMFYGHDGTDYANAAGYMRVLVDGTVANNQVPGQLQFGVNDGSTATTAMTIHKTGSVLFSGLTDKNDPRNAEGIAIKSASGISFQNFGANGSHNWRIRPDDLVDWGTLEFSVSPTANSATDWPDSLDDTVLTLKPDKNVLVNNGNIEANDNTLSAVSKTASSTTYVDVFVYDTRKDSDGGAWRHRTTNTSWYNETLNTTIRGARREFPQVAVIGVGLYFIHIFDADDPDMPMWMEFPSPSGGARNVMYGSGNPRCVYMLNGILCTGSQATNYWPLLIDFIRDDVIGLRAEGTGHLHYHGTQGNISLRNSATSDSGLWWPGTITGGPNGGARVQKRWWFDGLIVNNHVTSVVMDVRPEAPIDKTTGMQIPTIYLGTRGGISIIHSNVGDIGTSYNSGIYDITSNGSAPYSAVGDMTITEDGFLWALHDYYNYNSDGGYNLFRDSSAVDLKRLDNQMNDMTHSPSADSYSSLNNQAGSSAQKGREYYWPSTGAEAGTHKIGSGNTWAADIVERNAWGCPQGLAFVKKSIYTYDHKENTSFLVRSHANRGLVAMITKDYNTGWHMTGNAVSVAYISEGLTSSISGADAMLDRGYGTRHLGVTGTLTRAKCATGSDLSCVSGFSSSNHARAINLNINAGNPLNITMMGWIKLTDISGYSYICSIANGGGAGMGIAINQTNATLGGKPYFYDSTHGSMQGDKSIHDGEWHHVCGVFSCSSNRKLLYVDGQRQINVTAPSNVDYSDLDVIAVGHWVGSGSGVSHSCRGSLALVKLGLTDLTDQQIKRIYEDEKKLLLPNAKAFLYGTSNDIKAIGYDEKKEIYHVGTSSGRSDFSGLSRINNTTTAVTHAISAYDGLIAEQ